MVNHQPYFNLSDIHTALNAKRLIISRKATNDYRNLGFEDVNAVIDVLLLLTAEDYYKSHDYPNSQYGKADAYLLNVSFNEGDKLTLYIKLTLDKDDTVLLSFHQ